MPHCVQKQLDILFQSLVSISSRLAAAPSACKPPAMPLLFVELWVGFPCAHSCDILLCLCDPLLRHPHFRLASLLAVDLPLFASLHLLKLEEI